MALRCSGNRVIVTSGVRIAVVLTMRLRANATLTAQTPAPAQASPEIQAPVPEKKADDVAVSDRTTLAGSACP